MYHVVDLLENATMGNIKADMFDSPNCRHNLTMGRDILLKMGINMDFDARTTRWMGHETAMASTTSIATDIPRDQHFSLCELEEEEDFELFAELYSDAIIMDRKYQAVSPEEVVQQLDHLNSSQKTQLQAVFEKYKRVFDGTLGCHPTAEIDIELVPGARPIY